ncbi:MULTISPECIES: hypothetical protein [Haloarcula]|uniref:hypothetical protein n=1 Tax=Haloarcula TaxID=2237 RepID=UPI00140F47F8|nr:MULTISPECIES: hypothetical protein [Halomicroarcula]MBX0348402.1 hypothetical protein [Halomicroarcula pellucida]MDS0278226.1 hypothetical protein [Halomicroarcula sp. S1AR25-4]QIO23875.1 hypothetical protein G9465_16580 [Haloarcula sp. JP-L23]
MSETYVCSNCQTTVERPFEIRSIIRTCDECGRNGRFLHRSLVDSLNSLPDDELPEDWESMRLDERFEDAIQRGLIEITRR